MARQTSGSGQGTSGSSYTFSLTVAGTNRLTILGCANRAVDSVDTIDYGTGNTIYDLGVDETRRVAILNGNRDLEVFRIFDVDHPANGAQTVTVTLETTITGGAAGGGMQWDDADQTTGYRGTPDTVVTASSTAWDLTSITNNAADQETVGFANDLDGSANPHTPDADNPEIFEESAGAGSGLKLVAVTDTTSRGTLGGDFVTAGLLCAWGASILAAVVGAGSPIHYYRRNWQVN